MVPTLLTLSYASELLTSRHPTISHVHVQPGHSRAAAFLSKLIALGFVGLLAIGCAPERSNGEVEVESGHSVGSSSMVVPEFAGAKPWTDLEVEDDTNNFHFVVVSDRTCCARAGVFASAMPKINLLAPAFVLSVGDLIEGYTENQAQLDREWDEIESLVGDLDAPFFYTPGNHDMNNAVMARAWQQRFGPSFYHFFYKDVLFVVLNSELFGMVGSPETPLPGPWQQSQQMDFVRSLLAQYPDPRWTVVLTHQPLWAARNIDKDWLTVEELLGGRDYTVFAGHNHQYSRVERHNRNFITLATTGGGSGLRGTAYGEFDHVAWVTMNDTGPMLANLTLDGILGEDASNPTLLAALDKVGQGLQIEAPVADNEYFTGAAQKVTIVNPTSEPMSVSPNIERRGNFAIDGLLPLTIEPGERVEFFLSSSTPEPVAYHELQTAIVNWTVTANIEGRLVQFPVAKPVLPLSKYQIGQIAEINIDGELGEWGSLKFASQGQGDITSPQIAAQDASFRFDVREGSEHLYVAVEVTDDDVQQHADLIPRAQDAVRVFVDPRPPELRDRSMGAGEAVLGGDMAAQVATIIATGPSLNDELLGFVEETNRNIDYVLKLTDRGYTIEIAIPMDYIQSKAGYSKPWLEAVVSLAVYDLDSDGHGAEVLHWKPYRYATGALAGSSLFRRQR